VVGVRRLDRQNHDEEKGRLGVSTTRSDETAARSQVAARAVIVLLGLMFVPTAIQAAFFPRSFHDDFPLGRGWVTLDGGAYNEHAVRDVGALFLALAIVSVWAWYHAALCRPVGVAWLVQGLLHLWYHIGHLDHFDAADKVGMIGSLGAVPVLAVVALVLDQRSRTAV
jgi:hypothetical protein